MPDMSATLPDGTPQRPVDITIVTGVSNFSLETVTVNYEPKLLGTSEAAQRVNVTSGFCPLYGCDAVSFVCFLWVYMLFVMKHALQG